METTDYCDYKLSLALKSCGFDEPCDHIYGNYDRKRPTPVSIVSFGNNIVSSDVFAQNYNNKEACKSVLDSPIRCSAPTLAHAQKWLREKKGIVVIAEPDWDSEDYCMADYLTGEWYFSVWKDGDRVHCNFDPNAEEERIWMFDKYEQALSAGISAALELIKKGE